MLHNDYHHHSNILLRTVHFLFLLTIMSWNPYHALDTETRYQTFREHIRRVYLGETGRAPVRPLATRTVGTQTGSEVVVVTTSAASDDAENTGRATPANTNTNDELPYQGLLFLGARAHDSTGAVLSFWCPSDSPVLQYYTLQYLRLQSLLSSHSEAVVSEVPVDLTVSSGGNTFDTHNVTLSSNPNLSEDAKGQESSDTDSEEPQQPPLWHPWMEDPART